MAYHTIVSRVAGTSSAHYHTWTLRPNFRFHALVLVCLPVCVRARARVQWCFSLSFWFISRNMLLGPSVSGWSGCLIIGGLLFWVHSTLSSAAVQLSASHYWIATVKMGMQLPLSDVLAFFPLGWDPDTSVLSVADSGLLKLSTKVEILSPQGLLIYPFGVGKLQCGVHVYSVC